MSSGNLIALQQLLGHHDISMTMVYAHLAPSYHAQDLARLTYAKPSADGGTLRGGLLKCSNS
jgi:site-specific recombinase XerC